MSEQTQRSLVVRTLKSLDALAVENPTHPGTPDVNYVEGWIELKWLRRWPGNADASPVLLPHFTKQQRVWLRRRWLKGGNVYLLWQVGKTWMLFDGATAAQVVGKATRPALVEAALKVWPLGLNKEEFVKCLSRKD